MLSALPLATAVERNGCAEVAPCTARPLELRVALLPGLSSGTIIMSILIALASWREKIRMSVASV
jgi:hypothetical protein